MTTSVGNKKPLRGSRSGRNYDCAATLPGAGAIRIGRRHWQAQVLLRMSRSMMVHFVAPGGDCTEPLPRK